MVSVRSLLRSDLQFDRFENRTLFTERWSYFCWNGKEETFAGGKSFADRAHLLYLLFINSLHLAFDGCQHVLIAFRNSFCNKRRLCSSQWVDGEFFAVTPPITTDISGSNNFVMAFRCQLFGISTNLFRSKCMEPVLDSTPVPHRLKRTIILYFAPTSWEACQWTRKILSHDQYKEDENTECGTSRYIYTPNYWFLN